MSAAATGTQDDLLHGCDDELRALQEKIQRERGFNCLLYKNRCLRRRIQVRMRARGHTGFADYAALLDHDPQEYERLLDALTINVTKFFRNPDTWAAVDAEVLPALFADAPGQRRIWSAGCSSGEEPYTLAILLREWALRNGRMSELHRFSILGTDIDRESLQAAERGEYPDHALTDTPAELRERWFAGAPLARLRDEAREGVTFRRLDMISQRAPRGCSLVVCRNVIIYFEREVQASVFQSFADALLPGGFLVLGKAETLHGPARAHFQQINARERVFRRI